MKTGIKVSVFIFLTTVCGIYSQLSCTYYDKQYYGYACNLTITNPTGLNNFKRISGRHLSGKTNNDVKYITSNSASFTTIVPSFICKTFKNLTSIELRSMGIQHVDENAFKDCHELQALDLYNNKISRIDEKAFENNQGLATLYLYQNQLSELPENVFLNQQNLITLWLDNNYFTSFPKKEFAPLNSLNNLDLRGNRIRNITDDSFENLKSIKYLYLQSTQIEELPKNVFRHLKSLSTLSLSYNKLKVIHSLGFLPNLTEIELSDNQLQAVDEKLIDNTGVNRFSFGGNLCANFVITDNSASRALLRSGLQNCFNKYNQEYAYEITTPDTITESPSNSGCNSTNLNKRICKLEDDNDGFNSKLEDLHSQIHHLISATEDLEADVQNLTEQNQELAEEIDKIIEEKQDLEEKFSAAIEELRDQVEELFSFISSQGDI
ncbi:hypothetical protein ACKWTF_001514 [Chironomus riparius]